MLETVERDVHWRERPREGLTAGMGMWIVLVRWPWKDCKDLILNKRLDLGLPSHSKVQVSPYCPHSCGLLEQIDSDQNHPKSKSVNELPKIS